MSNSVQEYLDLARGLVDLEDDEPIPPEIMQRLNAIARKFDCQCCGQKAPGRFGPWPECNCSHFRRCEGCQHCLEHCPCVSRGEILKRLRAESERYGGLINQAHKLAVGLGLYELEGGWTTEDLDDLEKLLKVQLHAVRRLSRRFSGWEMAHIELGNLGDPQRQAEAPEVGFLNPPYIENEGGVQ